MCYTKLSFRPNLLPVRCGAIPLPLAPRRRFGRKPHSHPSTSSSARWRVCRPTEEPWASPGPIPIPIPIAVRIPFPPGRGCVWCGWWYVCVVLYGLCRVVSVASPPMSSAPSSLSSSSVAHRLRPRLRPRPPTSLWPPPCIRRPPFAIPNPHAPLPASTRPCAVYQSADIGSRGAGLWLRRLLVLFTALTQSVPKPPACVSPFPFPIPIAIVSIPFGSSSASAPARAPARAPRTLRRSLLSLLRATRPRCVDPAVSCPVPALPCLPACLCRLPRLPILHYASSSLLPVPVYIYILPFLSRAPLLINHTLCIPLCLFPSSRIPSCIGRGTLTQPFCSQTHSHPAVLCARADAPSTRPTLAAA